MMLSFQRQHVIICVLLLFISLSNTPPVQSTPSSHQEEDKLFNRVNNLEKKIVAEMAETSSTEKELENMASRSMKLGKKVESGRTFASEWNYDSKMNYYQVKVSFTKPRQEIPKVFTRIRGGNKAWFSFGSSAIYNLSNTGFTVKVMNLDNIKQHVSKLQDRNVYMDWMAFYS